MAEHNLVIVGSGSGNSLVTPDFDDWDIAIVEAGRFGGTCLNVGCIPTKMFVYPADLAAAARDWPRLGLHGTAPIADWAAIRDRVFARVDAISAGGRDYRRSGTENVTLYEAHARFTGDRTLQLSTGETLRADQIVLATGSRATVPPLITGSGVPFHTSDTIMRIDALPRRLVILGGGYIASEFAHVFSAFGVDVTVVSRTPLLRELDQDIAERFAKLVGDRWHVRVGQVPNAVRSEAGPGGTEIVLDFDDGPQVRGDLLLVATGRVPNGDRLDLPRGGVDAHDDGRIRVDDYQRTSAAGVWALGDASSEYQLKHVANHEERVVAHNLAHPEDLRASDHRFVPAGVFTHPQLASVGLTEQQARDAGRPYTTAIQEFGATAYGWAMDDEVGFCKVLLDPSTGLLIGAHIMGEQATTLIQPLIQAMSFGLPAAQMAHGQYWIHPALTEVVENALLSVGKI